MVRLKETVSVTVTTSNSSDQTTRWMSPWPGFGPMYRQRVCVFGRSIFFGLTSPLNLGPEIRNPFTRIVKRALAFFGNEILDRGFPAGSLALCFNSERQNIIGVGLHHNTKSGLKSLIGTTSQSSSSGAK